MFIKIKYKIIVFISIGFFMNSCVESFVPQTVTFESALVIDATITNELKQQEIILSRTYAFEDDGPQAESNATIKVVDDAQNEYVFEETTPGTYVSTTTFSAQPNSNYQLLITTGDGRNYVSETEQLTQVTTFDDLYAERITNDDGIVGMAIYVDSFDPTNSSKHYRYEYEETYKIIAPKWNSKKFTLPVGPDISSCDVEVSPKGESEKPCFATDPSNNIIVTNTNEFIEDRVSRFPVRFINRNNYIISHRYSILVKQYVQSSKAYIFLETLRDFSGSESLFSETQPGFLAGNISSVENKGEKVLGYFEVSTVTERRIYFNYDDFFPGEPLPPYIEPCVENAPPLSAGAPPKCVLKPMIQLNLVSFAGENATQEGTEGPFLTVPRVCGYCTEIGSTVVPGFWME